jgi:hypothetical protein
MRGHICIDAVDASVEIIRRPTLGSRHAPVDPKKIELRIESTIGVIYRLVKRTIVLVFSHPSNATPGYKKAKIGQELAICFQTTVHAVIKSELARQFHQPN